MTTGRRARLRRWLWAAALGVGLAAAWQAAAPGAAAPEGGAPAAAAPAPAPPAAPVPGPAAGEPKAAPPVGEAAPEEAGAAGKTTQPPTLFELLQLGGPLMYPIYLCSILALAFAIERAVSLRRGRVLPSDFIENIRQLAAARPMDREKILTYCLAHPSPISRILAAAVKRLHRPLPEVEKTIEDAGAKEVRLLRRNCRVLSGAAYIAPLLGLLGTVQGMIQCFMRVSTSGALGKAEQLAEGIYLALVTTAAGLAVAIPAATLYLLFAAKIEKRVAEMDDLAMEFVETTIGDGKDSAA